MERRLTAILAADVVGYSRMMGANEAGTLDALKAVRTDFVDGKITQHGFERIESPGLIRAHHPAVADNVGGEDRSQTPFHVR